LPLPSPEEPVHDPYSFRPRAGQAPAPSACPAHACRRGAAAGRQPGLAACSGKDKGKAKGPVEVGYWVATESTVPLEVELPGRTAPFRVSQVRPQVNGIIEKRLFEEGAIVKEGQPLYRIDPSLYRAAANQAQANLTSAQASAEAAKVKADRYKPLAAARPSRSRITPMPPPPRARRRPACCRPAPRSIPRASTCITPPCLPR
jgi:multidrug efflux pump subunit AcrA (membrane-fusion protein)